MGGDEPSQNGESSLANSHSQVTGQLISLVAFDWLNIFIYCFPISVTLYV